MMQGYNIGLYYGEESGLPLYYRAYPGSISDKAHLRYMVEDNEFINGTGKVVCRVYCLDCALLFAPASEGLYARKYLHAKKSTAGIG